MVTPYKEPNVYTTVKRVTPAIPRTPVDMYPLIIGTGTETIKRTNVPLVVTEDKKIVFEENVISIASVITVDEWGDATTLDAEKYSEEKDGDTISGISFADDFEGDIVYVSYTAGASEDRFTLKRWTHEDDISDFYGAEVENGIVNKICVGGRLAKLAGSPVVYTLQIKTPVEGVEDIVKKYYEALTEHIVDKAGEPIWRICPVDAGVGKSVKRFVEEMSEPEERAEKYASLNCTEAESCTKYDALFAAFTKFCQQNATYRGQTLYPNAAKYTCADGTEINVTGELIACAFAGLEQNLERHSQSATHSEIPGGLLNLKSVKLKRKEKNNIAALGVTLLVQDNEYGPIMVRDSLSLDRSTAQVEDPCVTMAVDYYAKDLRNACAPYIGKYNVDTETISKVRATIDSVNADHIQKKNLKAVALQTLEQDPDNLQSLIVGLTAGVLYPLKQINVNIVLE